MQISSEPMDLKGYKAVIAGSSSDNCGQLAIDLLIASTHARKIGSIWHEGVLPLVGSDEAETKSLNLTISTEIFVCESNKYIFLRIRTRILQYLQEDFKNTLSQWMTTSGIEFLIILASSQDVKKNKAQVDDPNTVTYIVSERADSIIAYQLMELRCLPVDSAEIEELKDDQGARLCMSLMSLCDSIEVPYLLLLRYCVNEGNTRPYANRLAALLMTCLCWQPREIHVELRETAAVT